MHATPISSFTDGSAAKILIDGREAEILIEGVRVTRVRMTRVRVDACIIGCGVVSEMQAEVVRRDGDGEAEGMLEGRDERGLEEGDSKGTAKNSQEVETGRLFGAISVVQALWFVNFL